MRFDVLTVLPNIFDCFLQEGVIGKAVSHGKVEVNVINIRDFAFDKHKVVDDVPYGGGPGMVLKPEPILRAYDELTKDGEKPYVLLTEPWGETFSQKMAIELSKKERIMIICGRYEGVDERVKTIVDKEVSIGDFVLTGGELPAMVIMDAVIRLVPGVLGNEESLRADSFMDRGLLGYPNYTRPAVFRGMKVPEVLLSGHHKKIELWRKEQSLKKTLKKNPKLIEELKQKGLLTKEELEILKKIKNT
ncbi:tRNA (guanine-N(1)-)-methyltransferase [Desulfurobacterium thermolithotrophum DSM 11699]|uniref:tRNA (guanine-N(1)-)-methyltransferase n=1 Tax=Desulfurobacterium thermolithotrophum (strain DSM 11699 / BSA) TaxID=868864 RepID=F0S1W6_DESTD|nr:tRNA (guanosine(37)-N1)-methyltransferase TrmD [Desulfurobacterium thermolithotrophum]ADY74047.1 tRNA (guanine-N(1)-)-methyltransferase [Desulfurobacterium thermolithotrophum DSM 11699]